MMTTQPHIEWMIRSDMYRVLCIENLCFEFPWGEDDFIRCLRTRTVVGMVARIGTGQIVGYMIYELHPDRLHVLNFAVDPAFQRKQVGTAMACKLTSKLSAERRNRIMLEVRETNLAALLFFKSRSFRALSVLKNHYEDSAEDAYLMQYRVSQPVSVDPILGGMAGPVKRFPQMRFDK